MNPQQSQTPTPYQQQPMPSNQYYGQASPPQLAPENGTNNSNKKKFMIIGAIVFALIIVTVIIVVVASSSSKKPLAASTKKDVTAGASAATWLSIQQNNDSISQNLSALDDSTDFPSDALTDTTLQTGR
jgi:uncharacterized membrane protein YvbJ